MVNFLSLFAGGTKALALAAEELEMDVQPLVDTLTTSVWADWAGLSELLIRFILNTFVIGLIVRVFYYLQFTAEHNGTICAVAIICILVL